MTRPIGRALLVFILLAPATAAQEKAKEQAPAKPVTVTPMVVVDPVVPLRANVVVARYDGEKRISSLPYTLSFNAARRGVAQVRMGAEIPMASASGDGASKGVNYDFIGTQIDCTITPSEDGRYALQVSVSEKSVYGEGQTPGALRGTNPSFRSYRSVNTVVLKVGESTQFTAAADRLTGEVVRVDVTLHGAK